MKVGFIGWRGMVGSVLMTRMKEENDFHHLKDAVFFLLRMQEAELLTSGKMSYIYMMPMI